MKSKVILGSGLVALLARKILGSNWKIIPMAPSRFYSKGVPALGDDFVVYDNAILDMIKDWGLNTTPLLYKRPYSISGSLLYNQVFSDQYFNKIGIESNPLHKDYFKCDFTVFSFSCLQLWNKLLNELVVDIKKFQTEHQNCKTIKSISNNTIVYESGDVIEYDEMISTIPYYKLCELTNQKFNGKFLDTYYYYINDQGIDLEKANQALVCDIDIPFHKCTKVSKNKYLLEIIDTYYENIQDELSKIIGGSFEILSGAVVQNGHVVSYKIDEKKLEDQKITCIGSYAQCDPLMDIGSSIKRIVNQLKKQKIEN